MMVKVVFLLDVSVEGWLIAERTVALCGRSEVLLRGTGTDVDVRHAALQRESPRRDIVSHATTSNHMIACAASSTRDRGMRRHVIPRCGRAFLHSRDTAETALQLNREAMPAQGLATFTILRGVKTVGCATV